MVRIEKYYLGSDLKFSLQIESPGFDMDVDDFDVTIINTDTGTEHKCNEDDIVHGNDGWYLTLDSILCNLGLGTIKAVVFAHVPDDDFKDGTRTEIATVNLCTLCSYK